MTAEQEIVPEYCIFINNYMLNEDRDPGVETRCLPVSRKTQYKILLRKARKLFGLKRSIDLGYITDGGTLQNGMKGGQQDNGDHTNNARWIHMSGDHDMGHILTRLERGETLELKVVQSSNNMSENSFRRGCKKGKKFIKEHGPDVLEAATFITSLYEKLHPVVAIVEKVKK